jgi:hypothetical protein
MSLHVKGYREPERLAGTVEVLRAQVILLRKTLRLVERDEGILSSTTREALQGALDRTWSHVPMRER